MKMSKLTFAALLVLATVPLALAQGTYTQIDYPGATETVVAAVNSTGDLSGWYGGEGFLLKNGSYTTISVQGANSTAVVGMNDSDQLVVETLGDGYLSFVYDNTTQTFTQISCSNIQTDYIFATAINNKGVVVGYTVGVTEYGFQMASISQTQCRQLTGPKGAPPSVAGVDTRGELLVSPYYLFSNGKYREVKIPDAPSAVAVGINPAGTALVGNYQSSPGTYVGFVYQNNVLTTLQFPGAVTTFATGVNSSGEVVGYFTDTSGVAHGFTWTPPADAEKK